MGNQFLERQVFIGMKIYAIMVIYNKCIADSRTFLSLKNPAISLIICDNSTSDFENKMYVENAGAVYIDMGGNMGLSAAYNRALDYIMNDGKIHDDDMVCLFDDDTVVKAEYFEYLKDCSADIVLPVVYDSAGIMSPVFISKNKVVKRFTSKEKLLKAPSGCLSGINSAMAIRLKIFQNYRYDEQMFLDYIDHKFIIDMKEQGLFPEICPVEIQQDFSAVTDSKETAANRFRLQKKDLRYFYSDKMWVYYYIVIKKHIKLALKYKDIRMMFCR